MAEESRGNILDIVGDLKLRIPYDSILNLAPLIRNWGEKAQSADPFISGKARIVLDLLEKHPHLRKPIHSLEDIHPGDLPVLEHLFSDNYAVDFKEEEAVAVTAPFRYEILDSTAKFREIIDNIDASDKTFREQAQIYLGVNRMINAFGFILRNVYGYEFSRMDVPLVIPSRNPKNGLIRYYNFVLNTRYVELESKEIQPIETKVLDMLVKDYRNVELWLKYLPAENFRFNGFVLLSLEDITEQVTLTRLQSAVLERNIMDRETLGQIELIIQNFLEIADMRVGMLTMNDDLDLLKSSRNFWPSILQKAGIDVGKRKNRRLIQHIFSAEKTLQIIHLDDQRIFSPGIVNRLKESGINTLILAPLYREEKLIGVLELGTQRKYNLTMAGKKMTQMLPVIEMAVRRSAEAVDNRIQTIIKENCTAIHPSVEWKFVREAYRTFRREQKSAEHNEMREIVFEKVFPLFGICDVRNSSLARSAAISEDLKMQFRTALSAIDGLQTEQDFILLDELRFLIEEKLAALNDGANPLEEEDIYGFVEREINATFRQLQKDGRVQGAWLQKYFDALDPELGIIYNRRKNFEESIQLINYKIGSLLERDQAKAQHIYPHYFEKFKTDGVDYNIYIGQSITPRIPFSNIYLKNLRLRQLFNMCRISHMLESIKPQLKSPLQVGQLIFVQNLPIDIRFKYEEKRFDVDGAHNARFEIVKKRIDKARIAGSRERLRQGGKIAIVYSHSRIQSEYLQYIEYLRHKGFLNEKIEFLEVQKMKGVEGLKALRVEPVISGHLRSEESYEDFEINLN